MRFGQLPCDSKTCFHAQIFVSSVIIQLKSYICIYVHIDIVVFLTQIIFSIYKSFIINTIYHSPFNIVSLDHLLEYI